MKNLTVDLHIHSTFSDGAFTPEEIVKHASRTGLAAVAITDHDNTDATLPAIKAGKKLGVEVVPGVELSVEPESPKDEEIHILGYYIDWQDDNFQEKLLHFREARRKRAYKILEKLDRLGVKIDPQQLFDLAGKGSVGRMHVAKVLKDEGFVDYLQEAFDRYLAYGKPAYVPKLRLPSQEAINLISRLGGISVIAHPLYGGNSKEIIQKLKGLGLEGIEVYYTNHSPDDIKRFQSWANAFSLLITGGSDCHGTTLDEEVLIGNQGVSYDVLIQLKEYRKTKLEKPLTEEGHT
ncbi:PHP domain-containing protein [bacterium]|nr:PHP domain-containing protein [bacterium]NIN91436.1 PHP domain-containing protein [bacterium]NIO72827.1 PHP domain-containing protein [bacterium]